MRFPRQSLCGIAVATTLALASGMASAAPASTTWNTASISQQSAATSAQFNAIACTDSQNCIAAGSYTNASGFQQGDTLTSNNGGQTWSTASLPSTTASPSFEGTIFFGATCPTTSDCVAVGTQGYSRNTVAISSNGGASWSTAKSVPQPSFMQNGLNAVSCPTTTRCVAVGSQMGTTQGQDQVLLSGNSGSTWSVVSAVYQPANTSNQLNGVSCPTASECVAVGYTANASGNTSNSILLSTNGGQTWNQESSVPQPSATNQWLTAVSCSSTNNCVAVGYDTNTSGTNVNEALVSNNGGQTWTPAASVPQPGISTNGDTLNAVSCSVNGYCVAVGQYASAMWVEQNQILVSLNNGSTWSLQAVPQPGGSYSGQALSTVLCTGQNACIVSGQVSDPNTGGSTPEILYTSGS